MNHSSAHARSEPQYNRLPISNSHNCLIRLLFSSHLIQQSIRFIDLHQNHLRRFATSSAIRSRPMTKRSSMTTHSTRQQLLEESSERIAVDPNSSSPANMTDIDENSNQESKKRRKDQPEVQEEVKEEVVPMEIDRVNHLARLHDIELQLIGQFLSNHDLCHLGQGCHRNRAIVNAPFSWKDRQIEISIRDICQFFGSPVQRLPHHLPYRVVIDLQRDDLTFLQSLFLLDDDPHPLSCVTPPAATIVIRDGWNQQVEKGRLINALIPVYDSSAKRVAQLREQIREALSLGASPVASLGLQTVLIGISFSLNCILIGWDAVTKMREQLQITFGRNIT